VKVELEQLWGESSVGKFRKGLHSQQRMMRLSLNIVLICFIYTISSCIALTSESTILSAVQLQGTYGEIAALKVYPAFQLAVEGVGNFTKDSMPEDPNIKLLRKSVGIARELMDVFVYAYPNDTGVGEDLFVDIREKLDTGYESIGFFKDLYDSQRPNDLDDDGSNFVPTYDKKELKEKREAVLEWKDDFISQFGPKDYDDFVRAPSPDQFFNRKKKNLSKYYWKAAKITPDHALNGIQNLQRLTGTTTSFASLDFQNVSQLTTLEGDNALVFHQLRKWLRCIDLLCGMFPEMLFGAPTDVTEVVAEVSDLVSTYGDLHDKIDAYDEAVEKGKKSKAKDLLKEINEDWKLIKKQQA
jgi:hypothetical protein